jgi:uncharacterized membrane protein
MARIVKAIDIAAPVEMVFDFVSNARNGLKYMANFTRFEPLGQPERGLGARVHASGDLLGVHYETQLEIIKFEPSKALVSRSTQGIKSHSIWQFLPLPDGGTEVTFVSDYVLPGGGLGRVLDRLVIEKSVEKNTIQTLINLKKVIEGKPNLRVQSRPELNVVASY